MAFTVRSLLARITPYRPDIKNEGDIDYIAQGVTKRLMKDTFYGRVTRDVFFLPQGVNRICISPDIKYYDTTTGAPSLTFTPGFNTNGMDNYMMVLPAGGSPDPMDSSQRMPVDVSRIHKVRVAKQPLNVPSTQFIAYASSLPSSSGRTSGDFYIMFRPGSGTNTDGNTLTWNSGDMAIWDGSKYEMYTVEQFSTVSETNNPSITKNFVRPQTPASTVSYWAQDPAGNAAVVTYNSTGPIIITDPQDVTIAVGQSATFSTVAEGANPLYYQWYVNDDPAAGATSASYTFTNAQAADNGKLFNVYVSDATGETSSGYATLYVIAKYFVVRPLVSAKSTSEIFTLYDSTTTRPNTIYVWDGQGNETFFCNAPNESEIYGTLIGFRAISYSPTDGYLYAYATGTAYGDHYGGQWYRKPYSTPSAAWADSTTDYYSPTTYGAITEVNVLCGDKAAADWTTVFTFVDGSVTTYMLKTLLGSGKQVVIPKKSIYSANADCSRVGVQTSTNNLDVFNTTSAYVRYPLNTFQPGKSIDDVTVVYYGTTYYAIYADNAGLLKIDRCVLTSTTVTSVVNIGTFNYIPAAPTSKRPCVTSQGVMIYLAAGNADGILSVMFNGTTVVPALSIDGNEYLWSTGEAERLNHARFALSGQAIEISDGSILHSTNSLYLN